MRVSLSISATCGEKSEMEASGIQHVNDAEDLK